MKGRTLRQCLIAQMLRTQPRHISFHTPGHKRQGADITELPYSDNLLSPTGVIARAERDIAAILGADASYILTDGSTCGVHAMMFALRAAGAHSVAFSAFSHKSVKEGCLIAGLSGAEFVPPVRRGIPLQPSEEEMAAALDGADALLLTSPDYYGFVPDLNAARALCDRAGKPLIIDGAHGAHLHFTPLYAGRFADMWVDGVHKSLPALTQGAVVSARGAWQDRLGGAVRMLRTTSPSYPIMASVEYAVRYPRNEVLELMARACAKRMGALANHDWSKIVLPFGDRAAEAERFLEKHGVYPEFNDGNYLMFYLSPCTRRSELKRLERLVRGLPRAPVPQGELPVCSMAERETELVPLKGAAGRICARECGIFPPCIPLVRRGERVSASARDRLLAAFGTFGLEDGCMLVYREDV